MKKWLSLGLALLLCLSMAACHTAPPDAPSSPSTTVTTTATTTEAAPTTTVTTTESTAPPTTTVATTTTTTAPTTTKTTTKATTKATTAATTTKPTTVTTTAATTTTTTKAPVAPGSTPILYKATNESGAVVWLFGSIHVGKEEMYPLPDYVMDAFYAADSLAVECDITATDDDAMTEMLYSMMYLDGTTIADHIPAELYTAAQDIFKENGDYHKNLDYCVPILWSNLIDSYLYDNVDYDSEMGVDLHLINLAKQEEKPLLEIESVQSQYAMLAGFSETLQTLLLQESVAGYGDPSAPASLDALANAWREGDEALLREMLSSDAAQAPEEIREWVVEYETAMSTNRDLLMTDFAEARLKAGESVFICVGAAHIVAENAIVDQLRARGYTVTRITV